MTNWHDVRGFTLLELLVAVVITAILAALAVASYQHYTDRARGAEIIEAYGALRTGFNAQQLSAETDDCAGVGAPFQAQTPTSPYASLSLGFEAVAGGYRPVLVVCADVARNGTQGPLVANEVHDTMLAVGVVEQGAVLTDSVVSFAMRLTDGDQPLCKTHAVAIIDACGGSLPQTDSPSLPTVTPTSSPSAATTATPTPMPVTGPTAASTTSPATTPATTTAATTTAATTTPATTGAVATGGSHATPVPVTPQVTGTSPAHVPLVPTPAHTGTGAATTTSHHQCVNQCKQTICHNCNSRAYRECVGRCSAR